MISASSDGAATIPDWREHSQREQERDEERLVDAAVHLVGISGAGKSGDEHAHAGEDRGDEHDDEDEDLQAGANGGVADVADVVADHRLVDDALQAADDVLHHGRPRQPPDRVTERALDYRPIELPGRRTHIVIHWSHSPVHYP